MTKRMLVIAGLVVSVAGFPSHASAAWGDLWDVLDNLSGPGPFHGQPVATGKIVCWRDGEPDVKRAGAGLDRNDPCLYFEFRRLHVHPQAPYSEVWAKMFGLGVEFQQTPWLDIGASAGTARFATTVGTADFTVTNFVVSPRLVFKPLRVFWPNKRRLGFLQMHYRPTIRFGQVDGSDFGVPASTFSAGTEFMPKGGSWIVVDVFELLRPS
jgi:hypothetical protein